VFNADDDEVLEGDLEAGDGFGTGFAPGDDFGEEGIVIEGDD
jgi:hypothetical protein